MKQFTASGLWQTTPPADAVVIPGVNDNNFFLTGSVIHYAPDGAHGVAPGTPEPSTMVHIALLGAIGLAIAWRRRKRRGR